VPVLRFRFSRFVVPVLRFRFSRNQGNYGTWA
jgi:hypothetical protein